MKKLKIGIVGLGRLGKRHAENVAFRIPNAELVAVCSIVKEEIDQVQSEWGVKYAYIDFNEMLKNPELDAILIASSSTAHCTQIVDALDAGFHVFAEKPLGVTLEEAEEVAQAVIKHKDKVFMLGFMRRYDPSYTYTKKLIDAGEIGEPFMVRCYGLDPVKQIEGAIAFAEKSGGIFLDLAIHDIDLSRWFLNDIPDKIFAIGGCFSYPEFSQFNDTDNAAALVQFKTGKMGVYYASRTCAYGYHIETEIIGTKGSLRVGTIPEKNLTTIFNEIGAVRTCSEGFLERFDQAYLLEIQEFVNCIFEKRSPAISVEDGVLATRIAYACRESLQQNKLVNFS